MNPANSAYCIVSHDGRVAVVNVYEPSLRVWNMIHWVGSSLDTV